MDILKARKKAKEMKKDRHKKPADDALELKSPKGDKKDESPGKDADSRKDAKKKTPAKKPEPKPKTVKEIKEKPVPEKKQYIRNVEEEEQFRRQILKELEEEDKAKAETDTSLKDSKDNGAPSAAGYGKKPKKIASEKPSLTDEYTPGSKKAGAKPADLPEKAMDLEETGIEDQKGTKTLKPQETIKFLIFRMGKELYSIDIMKIKKIDPIDEITRVPNTPPFVLGIISLRGEIIPILDLKKKLLIKDYKGQKKPTIIILNEQNVGVLIDFVVGVKEIKASDIEKSTTIVGSIDSEFITGIVRYKNMVFSILDITNLIKRDIFDGLNDYFSDMKL